MQAPDLRLLAEREAALAEAEDTLERQQGDIADAQARLPAAQQALPAGPLDAERQAQRQATELKARRDAGAAAEQGAGPGPAGRLAAPPPRRALKPCGSVRVEGWLGAGA